MPREESTGGAHHTPSEPSYEDGEPEGIREVFPVAVAFLALAVGVQHGIVWMESLRPVIAGIAHLGLMLLVFVCGFVILSVPFFIHETVNQNRLASSLAVVGFVAMAALSVYLAYQPLGDYLVGGAFEHYAALHENHAQAAVEASGYEETQRHSQLAGHYATKAELYEFPEMYGYPLRLVAVLGFIVYGVASIVMAWSVLNGDNDSE